MGLFRTVSEYCSASVCRVGLSTKQATSANKQNYEQTDVSDKKNNEVQIRMDESKLGIPSPCLNF